MLQKRSFIFWTACVVCSFQLAQALEAEETSLPDDFSAAQDEIQSWNQEVRLPASSPFLPGSSDSGGSGASGSAGTANSNAASGSPPTSPRKATLNFEDELVEGGTQKPELFYLFQKKNFNYKRLIKLRENFIPEMRRTAEDVQRVRGAN